MSTVQEETKALLTEAVERANLAPSVHNTQPWHFVVRPDVLELHGDNDRQLRALDPTGRQMVISCGCALFNARVGLAADRMVDVDRLPDAAKPDLLARLTLLDEPAPWTPLVRIGSMIEKRHTSRRDFFDEDVPPDVIYELTTAAEQEGASLVQIVKPEHKMVATQLSREAETIQNMDPRYQAELQAWTTTDLRRTDGVPVSAIPHTDSRFETEGLIRDFDVAGKGCLPRLKQSSLNHCLMVLGTAKSTRFGVVARRGAAAHPAGSHPVGRCGQPCQPRRRSAVHPGPPSQRARSRVSSTSLDEDRPCSANAGLQAPGSDPDHFRDNRLT
jgi:hypothetical protein